MPHSVAILRYSGYGRAGYVLYRALVIERLVVVDKVGFLDGMFSITAMPHHLMDTLAYQGVPL